MQFSQGSLEEATAKAYLAQVREWGARGHWAWAVVHDLVTDAPELGWPLVREIVRRAPSDLLTVIGADGLEDLLAMHGRDLIGLVEREARESPKLRVALANVSPGRLDEDVRPRLANLIDETARAAVEEDLEFDPPYRVVDLFVEGRPPTRQGDGSSEQVERRGALLHGLQAAAGSEFIAWQTPVGLDVRVESGPDGDSSASADEVLAAICETLALDRPSALVARGYETIGLVAERRFIRDAECFDVFSHQPSYRVMAHRMSDDEVQARADPRSIEELLADEELRGGMQY